MQEPKVFISYSWSSSAHQELVQYWADRLISDGVDVILDVYDLKEGHDKYKFMESMVTDELVTHVLVICDKLYAEKANTRKGGVSTETQIISSEVYTKVKQSKFIPIICELDDDGEPILPVFMKARIGINFSSSEAVNENWEQLVRLLYGKPQHVKPKKGKVPTFITSNIPTPTNEAIAKFSSLKQAIFQDKKGISHYRRDFIDSCISYADNLRVRERPDVESLGIKIVEDCGKLKAVRNHLCDWILLESEVSETKEFSETLIDVLEKLRELKSRPSETNSWNDSWFDAHSIFVYETFLYIIAALLKTGAYSVINEIYTSHYIMPSTESNIQMPFERFDCFFGHSDIESLHSALSSSETRFNSPAAELIKRQADREDIPFSDIRQAELLTLLMSCIVEGAHWYPSTLLYSTYLNPYPFFIKATQHKNFLKLAKITGVDSAGDLRKMVKDGMERLRISSWREFRYGSSFWLDMNMDNLDNLK